MSEWCGRCCGLIVGFVPSIIAVFAVARFSGSFLWFACVQYPLAFESVAAVLLVCRGGNEKSLGGYQHASTAADDRELKVRNASFQVSLPSLKTASQQQENYYIMAPSRLAA